MERVAQNLEILFEQVKNMERSQTGFPRNGEMYWRNRGYVAQSQCTLLQTAVSVLKPFSTSRLFPGHIRAII